MKLNSLGFDYSNLSTCTIKTKNRLLSLVMFILTGSFLPMSIVFIIIYMTKSPIRINGNSVNFGESAYNAFFFPFIITFLSISFLFLFIGFVALARKPKTYLIMDRDTTNFDTIYYIFNRKKKDEIYLSDKYVVVYNSLSNVAYYDNDPKKIKNFFDEFIFWNNFDTIENAKVRQNKKNTVVKIKTPTSSRYSGSIIKKYVFSNSTNVVPETVSESIGYARAGSTSYQSNTVYLFENINRPQHLQIHPEIKKILQGLT